MSLNRHIDLCIFDDASAASDKFDRIGEVQEIGGIDMSAETTDNTPYGSDQDDWMGYDYGLKDGGEVSVTIRYDSANTKAQALADAFFNSTKQKIALKFPANIGKQFEATVLVTNVGIPMEKGNKTDRTYTLKVSGTPVFNDLVPIT